jgi:phage N-6-adenine-methyltransferase
MAAMTPSASSVSPRDPPSLPLSAAAAGAGRGYMPRAKSTQWQTPPALFDALAAEFGPFDLDPCGAKDSYASQHCRAFWTAAALDRSWSGKVFINPPYGLALRDWVYHSWFEAKHGRASLVVALLPARTDTKWWHDWIGDRCQHAEVRFLKGRLRFVGAKASAPFPSVIVVWRKDAPT